MDYRIREILVKVEKNLSQSLTAMTLAQQYNVSPSYLQNLFKKEVGVSLAKYVKNARMQKSLELLKTSHLRIQEILTKIGVSEETHFLRDFKKKFGKTPTQYRKNYLEIM